MPLNKETKLITQHTHKHTHTHTHIYIYIYVCVFVCVCVLHNVLQSTAVSRNSYSHHQYPRCDLKSFYTSSNSKANVTHDAYLTRSIGSVYGILCQIPIVYILRPENEFRMYKPVCMHCLLLRLFPYPGIVYKIRQYFWYLAIYFRNIIGVSRSNLTT